MSVRVVAKEKIAAAISQLMAKYGFSDEQIADIQYGLIEPSLRGIDTHGIRLLECYLKELDGGRSNPKARLKLSASYPATATLDAGGALGILAGMSAMRHCMALADTHGIGWVSVKNSNHFGAASVYSLYAAQNGYIGLSFSNADALIAPEGGNTAVLGTNPISIAAPVSDGAPFCLDMACSQVAYSNVMHRLNTGQSVPESWMHAPARDSETGALKPLGGYKGAGLAIMAQLLTSVLTLSPLDHQLSHLYAPPYDRGRDVCHAMMVLKIEAFADTKLFKQHLSSLLHHIRSAPAIDRDVPVLVPGDKEYSTYQVRSAQGIPLTEREYNILF